MIKKKRYQKVPSKKETGTRTNCLHLVARPLLVGPEAVCICTYVFNIQACIRCVSVSVATRTARNVLLH